MFKFKISPLLLLAPIALLAPLAQAKPTNKLPAAVAAMMPANTLDIATYKLAPAPGEPQILVHLWTAPRRNPEGGGTFGAPGGFYKGKVGATEAKSNNSLYLSPFVYDIFTPNGKGGWNYMNTFIVNANSAPYKPALRYLNNKTKSGYIFEVGQFGGQYSSPYTIYVFRNTEEPGYPYLTRDMLLVSPPANSGQRSSGFGRDARGYAQIIESKTDWDKANKKPVTKRTITNWDEQTGEWADGKFTYLP